MPNYNGSMRIIDERNIQRRIAFLLNEAKSDNPAYDQVVRYALRVISNFYSCGDDVSSSKARLVNKHISRRASDLRAEISDDKKWIKKVTNEHQEPLRQVWDRMIENKDTLTLEMIATWISRWPMVVVTTCENNWLREKAKMRPKGSFIDAEQRYRDVGIEVIRPVE
ncbi:MAG: hypothetical protein WCA36_01610 [Pseudolabrys sp.]